MRAGQAQGRPAGLGGRPRRLPVPRRRLPQPVWHHHWAPHWARFAFLHLRDQLPDAPDIDLARAFYLAGDPHLLMYKNDGGTDDYRVRGDCRGWTKPASLTTVENATEVVPYQVAEQTFALFF